MPHALEALDIYIRWLTTTEKMEAAGNPRAGDARVRTNQIGVFAFRVLGGALVEVGRALQENNMRITKAKEEVKLAPGPCPNCPHMPTLTGKHTFNMGLRFCQALMEAGHTILIVSMEMGPAKRKPQEKK